MGFFDKAKELGTKTIEKGKEMAEITRLNIEITSYEDQIKEAKIKIGDLVLESGLPVPEGTDIPVFIDTIHGLKSKIDDTAAKIQAIKNINTCKQCGADVPRGEKFCGKCGNPMQTTEVISEAAEVISEAAAASTQCPDCGTEIPDGSSFCSNCGKSI